MSRVVPKDCANFEPKISLTNPLQDYIALIDQKLKTDDILPWDVHQECWQRISAAARNTIWKLLFKKRKNSPSKKHLQQAAELLKILKKNSAEYRALEYNNWIVEVRDELLKRNMLKFWREEVVKNELGPCWARDSYLFYDSDDYEPEKFYNHGHCEAPWLRQTKRIKLEVEDTIDSLISSTVYSPKSDVKLRKLSHDNAVEDYKYNMVAVAVINPVDPDYLPVFEEVRERIWNFLFTEPKLSTKNYNRAAELLFEYKKDAVYHNPWDYNDWIPAVRDELLKMKFFDFWKNVMVKNELGICWAGDSDYFDDMQDPEAVEFYNYADCKAPWLIENL